MRLKQRPEDFRVRELLAEGFLARSGQHRVYRVSKRKLTSLEAAAALAREAGVPAAEVSLAGLKDRQGVTVQYMSLARGRPVTLRSRELSVETVGFSDEPVGPAAVTGNDFEIVLRALEAETCQRAEAQAATVREHGLPNYFDDQRFRNLEQGQGWIALDLLRGDAETALRSLLAPHSPFESDRERRFRTGLRRCWGDWKACRQIAGRYGAHHSIFEHLARHEGDFAGAFRYVGSRLRLIHLYAFQSHLWNRAVAELVERSLPAGERVVLRSTEGPLPCHAHAPPEAWGKPEATFRLPGPRLADVEDPVQRACYEAVLELLGLTPEELDVRGVPGFQLKGEDRPAVLRPARLALGAPRPDPENRGLESLALELRLGRGQYATLVVKRLLAESPGGGAGKARAAARGSGYSAGRTGAGRAGEPQRGRRDVRKKKR